MAKIRVLVVDDAVVFRKLISDELNKDPDLLVVGTAANGKIALSKLSQLAPDVIVLDVEMPELDGLSTLKALRKTHPRLPVIMFSALTERGAAATLDALASGATDYFTKPANAGSVEGSLAVIREQLIPKIKALCPREPLAPQPARLPRTSFGPRVVQVVAIGCSTGGPNALSEIFRRLPADFPLPIVIVQHMPPMFTRLLAERLTAQFALKVHEGEQGMVLEPGHAYVAPGDHHMVVARENGKYRISLNQEPQENSCRPSVDVLFRSLARTFGPNVLAAVLTGMGSDGLLGSERLRESGSEILAQDQATSVVWGMPGYVVRAGLADKVLPIELVADEILRRIR